MARYNYDVNTTRRYIDVHKQFNGGLKTVDTDDSLGAVFLRDAQNVSLSEFGFIEKRYGTYEKGRIIENGTLQGYWEFQGHVIYAADGAFYLDGTLVENITKNLTEIYSYPENLPEYNEFQTTRQMGAIEINKVLYIFTGSYPIHVVTSDYEFTLSSEEEYNNSSNVFDIGNFAGNYADNNAFVQAFNSVHFPFFYRDYIVKVLVVVGGNLVFRYLKVSVTNNNTNIYFIYSSVTKPSYDEIVVVGHNLLEENYEDLYFSGSNTNEDSLYSSTEEVIIEEADFYPKLPHADGGFLGFNFKVEVPSVFKDFYYDTNTKFYQIEMTGVDYRVSGAGASDLDFVPFEEDFENDAKVYNNFYENFEEIEAFYSQNYDELFFDREFTTTFDYDTEYTNSAFGNYYFVDIQKDILIPKNFFPKAGSKMFMEFEKQTNSVESAFEPVVFKDFAVSNATLTSLNNEGIDTTNYNITDPFITFIPYSLVNGVPSFYDNEFTIPFIKIYENKVFFDFPSESYLDDDDIDGVAIRYNQNLIVDNDDPTTGETINTMFNNTVFTSGIADFIERGNTNLFPFESPKGILDFKITEALISGTYDFRVNFSVKVFDATNYATEVIVFDRDASYTVSPIIRNVTITQEKLQDYPGSEGVPVEPQALWTCNQVTEHFGKLMVWGSTEMPNSLFYSFPDRPTYFPSKFYLNFGTNEQDPIQAVTPYMNILAVQTKDQTWGLRGNSGYLDSPAPYVPFMINPNVGTIAPKSVRTVRNNLMFLSKQGVISLKSLYAVDEQYNIDFADLNIRNIVPQDEDAVGIQFDNQYWLNFPNYGITLRWYIDKKAWVKDTFGGYKNNYTGDTIEKPGAWDQFNGVFKYQIVDGKLEFITKPSRFEDTGNLSIYKVGIDYTLPTDLFGTTIAYFETSYLNQNYPFHPKNYKETKLDFTIQNEYNLGREPIYEMETNEDISQDALLTVDSPELIPNHRYQMLFNFTDYEITIIDAGDFGDETQFTETIDAGENWAVADSDPIDASFFNLLIEDVQLNGQSLPFTTVDENTLEFVVPTYADVGQDLVVVGSFDGYEEGASLIDSTYDYILDFRTWVVSEEQTLNLDNYTGYDQSQAEIPVQIGAKFGDWQFGLSDFGNKVTAVKTIKLSGRGYNSKVYFEDYSKSKWTLESLGITFKMKRARSR